MFVKEGLYVVVAPRMQDGAVHKVRYERMLDGTCPFKGYNIGGELTERARRYRILSRSRHS